MPVTISGSNTPTAGGAVYGDGTAYATTAAGTSGQLLTSAGASAPSWTTVSIPPIVGAVDVGSVVMLSRPTLGSNAIVPATVAFNGYNQHKTASSGTLIGTMSNAASDGTIMMGKPIYSSYYGLWFVAATGNDSTNRKPLYCTSVNGVNWNVNSVLLESKVSQSVNVLSAVSIAVNTTGVIQLLLWSNATGGNYVAASSDGGYTWTGNTTNYANSNGSTGYVFNCSVGTNFYVAGRNASDTYVASFNSTGTTQVGTTATSGNTSLWQWADWTVTSSGIYFTVNSPSSQVRFYNISTNILGSVTAFGGTFEGTTISNSSTYVLAGCYGYTTLFYSANINTTTVTWSTLSADTITGGSTVYTRWVTWTGSAWLAAFYTTTTANPSFGGSAVYYNTSANPGAGTWTKMTVNLGLANQYGPFVNTAVSFSGVGSRLV